MKNAIRFFALLCLLLTSLCSGAHAQTGKSNEEKKFGEDLILKMTEPPSSPPSADVMPPTSTIVSPPAAVKTDVVAPKPSRVLSGRIEQLMDTQQPAFPFALDGASAALEKPNANQNILTSYPATLRGTWVGTAVVDENSYSAIYELKGSVLVRREKAILYPGRTGELSVIFEPDLSGQIKDVSAKIGFRPTNDDLPYLDMVLKPAPGADPSKPASIPATLKYSINFGTQSNGRSITGVISDRTEVANRILRLNPAVIEQLIGVQIKSTNPTTMQVSSAWTETVIKFQRLSASQMLAQIASVRYSSNGIYLCKQIFHGTITRVAGSDLGPKK